MLADYVLVKAAPDTFVVFVFWINDDKDDYFNCFNSFSGNNIYSL